MLKLFCMVLECRRQILRDAVVIKVIMTLSLNEKKTKQNKNNTKCCHDVSHKSLSMRNPVLLNDENVKYGTQIFREN